LFYIKPEWLNDVKYFFENRTYWGHVIGVTKVERAKPFTLKNNELYKMGQNNKLRRCLTTT
jgi:hypothetical protein